MIAFGLGGMVYIDEVEPLIYVKISQKERHYERCNKYGEKLEQRVETSPF